jgi:hypothetical protein
MELHVIQFSPSSSLFLLLIFKQDLVLGMNMLFQWVNLHERCFLLAHEFSPVTPKSVVITKGKVRFHEV